MDEVAYNWCIWQCLLIDPLQEKSNNLCLQWNRKLAIFSDVSSSGQQPLCAMLMDSLKVIIKKIINDLKNNNSLLKIYFREFKEKSFQGPMIVSMFPAPVYSSSMPTKIVLCYIRIQGLFLGFSCSMSNTSCKRPIFSEILMPNCISIKLMGALWIACKYVVLYEVLCERSEDLGSSTPGWK